MLWRCSHPSIHNPTSARLQLQQRLPVISKQPLLPSHLRPLTNCPPRCATGNPARWVLAVPEDSPVHCAADLAGTIVASELVNTTRRYFAERGVKVKKVRHNQWDGKCAALCCHAKSV